MPRSCQDGRLAGGGAHAKTAMLKHDRRVCRRSPKSPLVVARDGGHIIVAQLGPHLVDPAEEAPALSDRRVSGLVRDGEARAQEVQVVGVEQDIACQPIDGLRQRRDHRRREEAWRGDRGSGPDGLADAVEQLQRGGRVRATSVALLGGRSWPARPEAAELEQQLREVAHMNGLEARRPVVREEEQRQSSQDPGGVVDEDGLTWRVAEDAARPGDGVRRQAHLTERRRRLRLAGNVGVGGVLRRLRVRGEDHPLHPGLARQLEQCLAPVRSSCVRVAADGEADPVRAEQYIATLEHC
mmetsp:Transcript_106381/g.297871  ORF Transcript_106381/g.297871 Transcript_106381/m.297871 type:complete len:297 (-) Transcript_106381:294-1184(-)